MWSQWRSARALLSQHRAFSASRWLTSAAEPASLETSNGSTESSSSSDNLSSEESLREFDAYLHQLSRSLRTVGRVLPFEVDEARRLLATLNTNQLSNLQALSLLRCCGHGLPDELPRRRGRIAQGLFKTFESKHGLKPDVSLYNALLQCQLDNEVEFAPKEVLSEMEERQVEPNRVTYQLLISRYCNMGDVAAATAILEHMKSLNMSIGSRIFQALIVGHCRNEDVQSAHEVIEVMKKSGLEVGADTMLTLLVSMIEAGKGWSEEVKPVMDSAISNEEFYLSDHDGFQLMVSLTHKGDLDAAREVWQLMPRKQGFFQEMRNFMPQLIHQGASELAFEVFKASALTSIEAAGKSSTAMRNNNGNFFLQALVKNEYPVDKVIDVLKQMVKENLNVEAPTKALQFCVDLKKTKYGRQLMQAIDDQMGSDVFKPEHLHIFIRNRVRVEKMPEKEVYNFFQRMLTIGLRPGMSTVTNEVLPSLLPLGRTKVEQPLQVLQKLLNIIENLEGASPIGITFINNAMIQFLLNQENKNDLQIAALIVTRESLLPRPLLWNASLGRSYLATGDLDSLLTIIATSWLKSLSMTDEKRKLTGYYVLKTLAHIHSICHRYLPDDDNDQVLNKVLMELKRCNVGLPDDITKPLLDLVNDDTTKSLINEMKENYDEYVQYWGSRDKVREFIGERRSLLPKFNFSFRKRSNSISNRSDEQKIAETTTPEFPNNMQMLQSKFEEQVKNNTLSSSLISRIMRGLAETGDIEGILKISEKLKERNFDFVLSNYAQSAVIEHLINENNLDKAHQLLKEDLDRLNNAKESKDINNSRLEKRLVSPFASLATSLIMNNKTEMVLDLMDRLDNSFFADSVTSLGFTDVMEASRNVDSELEEKLLKILESKNIGTKYEFELKVLKGDYNGAVEDYENLVKSSKTSPGSFAILSKLITLKDTSNVQRVLDALMSVFGEQSTLTDLVLCFLKLEMYPQAKKLLDTPGLRYDSMRYNRVARVLQGSRKLKALEWFVVNSRQVFACDRDEMYTNLVNALIWRPHLIANVWLSMQEEGHVPSKELIEKMRSVLKDADLQMPPGLEE